MGADADLIFSPSLTFYISEGINVALNWATCSVQSNPVDTFTSSMNQKVRVAASASPYSHHTSMLSSSRPARVAACSCGG